MALVDGDMSWMLASAALCQLMTPGLAFFYGGLMPANGIIATLMMNFGTMGVVTILWGLIGYSLAYGPNTQSGVVGDASDALVPFGSEPHVLPGPTPTTLTITENVYMVYELTFAIITAAIISGSVVSRMKYLWFLAFVAFWHIFVYCPLAFWIFNTDGWIVKFGAVDFAGGLVVHTSSGVSAVVLAYWVGKRYSSRFPTPPHNIPFTLLGAALLWFGWFGFNAGSALAATATAGRAFVNTQFSATAAMMTWGMLEVVFNGERWFQGRPTAVGAACGAVAGLVGITPAAGYVTAMWALFFGFVTVLVVFFQPRIIKRVFRVDDRLDCYAFHGAGGITGSLLTGLFASTASGSPVNGAFYGNWMLLWYEIAALLVVILWATVATTLICLLLRFLARVAGGSLLLDDEVGADTGEHGEQAYFRGAERFVEKGPTGYEVYGAEGVHARSGTGASRSSTEAHSHVCSSCGHVSVVAGPAPMTMTVLQPVSTPPAAGGLHHRYHHSAPVVSTPAAAAAGLSSTVTVVEDEPERDTLQLPPAVFLQLEASLAMMGAAQAGALAHAKLVSRPNQLAVATARDDAAATSSSASAAVDVDPAMAPVAAVTPPPVVRVDLQSDSTADERT